MFDVFRKENGRKLNFVDKMKATFLAGRYVGHKTVEKADELADVLRQSRGRKLASGEILDDGKSLFDHEKAREEFEARAARMDAEWGKTSSEGATKNDEPREKESARAKGEPGFKDDVNVTLNEEDTSHWVESGRKGQKRLEHGGYPNRLEGPDVKYLANGEPQNNARDEGPKIYRDGKLLSEKELMETLEQYDPKGRDKSQDGFSGVKKNPEKGDFEFYSHGIKMSNAEMQEAFADTGNIYRDGKRLSAKEVRDTLDRHNTSHGTQKEGAFSGVKSSDQGKQAEFYSRGVRLSNADMQRAFESGQSAGRDITVRKRTEVARLDKTGQRARPKSKNQDQAR